MTPPRVLTSVTLLVPEDRSAEVPAAFRALVDAHPVPAGLLRSELLRAQDGRWLVQTVWRDRDAVLAARDAGARPAALLLADQLGATHTHDVLTVEATLEP